MDANDLRRLIEYRNKEASLNPKVDGLINMFHEAISRVYDMGNGGIYTGCKQVGIAIQDVDLETLNPEKISFSVDQWIMKDHATFEKYGCITFWNFIDKPLKDWQHCDEVSRKSISKIYDQRCRDIVTMFEKLGFRCYVDVKNFQLIAAFEI